jgi:hypothetical protein
MAQTAMDPKEAQYNELIDYSHYVVVNDLRSEFENPEVTTLFQQKVQCCSCNFFFWAVDDS